MALNGISKFLISSTLFSSTNLMASRIHFINFLKKSSKASPFSIVLSNPAINSFYFFDLNSYYSDSDGFLDSNKRDDSVHLIFSDFIDESIEKMIEYYKHKETISS